MSGNAKSDIGLIGLAVMGQNLVLNMADHGYTVSVFNRTTSKMEDFVKHCQENEPSAERVIGHAELKDFVDSIATPPTTHPLQRPWQPYCRGPS